MSKRDIGRKARFLPKQRAPRRNIAIKFGVEKLVVWLPDGEKNVEYMIIRFDTIHERNRQ